MYKQGRNFYIDVRERDLMIFSDKFCTEASTLGLKPGQWPNIIRVMHDEGGWTEYMMRGFNPLAGADYINTVDRETILAVFND